MTEVPLYWSCHIACNFNVTCIGLYWTCMLVIHALNMTVSCMLLSTCMEVYCHIHVTCRPFPLWPLYTLLRTCILLINKCKCHVHNVHVCFTKNMYEHVDNMLHRNVYISRTCMLYAPQKNLYAPEHF